MKNRFFWCLVTAVCAVINSQAQSYSDSIAAFRKNYKEDFIKEERSPLKGKDTAFLRFYPVKKEYRLQATVALTPDAPTFDMMTHSGKKQVYRQYAMATFVWKGKKYTVSIYQNMNLIQKEQFRKHLFLPFNDLTNYETTYAGGRYIDLSTDDIVNGTITIDFNKCYNPYCAYAGGYSCPIPPQENKLQLRIEAGEQLFAGPIKD